jgi:hypothetical protein
MSGVFQNIDPPPPHRPAGCYPHAFGAGGGRVSLGGEGVGRPIFWKTPDTALYSTYVSTLWFTPSIQNVVFDLFFQKLT